MNHKYTPFAKIAPLLLFALLAAFLLHTVFLGTEIYASVNLRENRNRILRTSAQYLATRTAQAEEVAAGDFYGCDAIEFREDFGGTVYLTRIYACDGYLRELFSLAGSDLRPEDGEKLMPLEELDVTASGGLLTVTLTSGEDSVRLVCAANNGGGTK